VEYQGITWLFWTGPPLCAIQHRAVMSL